MKNYVGQILILTSLLCACKTGKQKNERTKNFFQLNDYLKSEIHYVDSLPIGITEYITQDNKTDTAYIQTPAFDKIAEGFTSDELKPEIFEKEFSETSFIDASTNAATFTYSTKNKNLELRRADVLAGAGEGINKISSIYLEKAIHRSDTLILKKMLWRTKISLQVVTSTEVPNQTPVVKQLKLVWGIE